MRENVKVMVAGGVTRQWPWLSSWTLGVMKLPVILMPGLLLTIAAVGGLFLWHRDTIETKLRKPHLVAGEGPNWLFVSRSQHITFSAHEARLIGEWLTKHQAGWSFGSLDDFDPDKTQLLCSGCGIEIDVGRIVLTYDEIHGDPDSAIYITRPLSSDEHAFWSEIISKIKTPNTALEPTPTAP